MRQPNDVRLAQEVPEIDVVLGGHDHFYSVSEVEAGCGCASAAGCVGALGGRAA
jgi:2',3'-cyclic-nucleotide 2'-phosphodiesterase (5'-nucleotidase family)